MNHILTAARARQSDYEDLPRFFRTEAAIHSLPAMMAKTLQDARKVRSDAAYKGHRTRRERGA